MSELKLAILTPEGNVFEGPITSVRAPGVCGSFAVHRDHAPFVSALTAGVVYVMQTTRERLYVIDGGCLEVRRNDAVILAGSARPADDVGAAKAMLAQSESRA